MRNHARGSHTFQRDEAVPGSQEDGHPPLMSWKAQEPEPFDGRHTAQRIPAAALRRRLVAEAIGTAFLLIAIVGSGILGDRLAAGNTGIALLANALASAATVFALIEWLAPLSGAHFNPVVTLAMLMRGDITMRAAAAYVPAQVIGAVIGVGVANAMFDVPLFSLSTQVRSGFSQLLSEFVSTFGLSPLSASVNLIHHPHAISMAR
jgi:hypothetical protein